MDFLIDVLIGLVILAVCYIVLIIVVKLPELAEQKTVIGNKAKTIYKILNLVVFIILAINAVIGIIAGIVFLLS